MQTAKCEKCGQQFPINETLKIENITLCKTCGEKIISEQKGIKSVKQQTDLTICTNCGKDNGSQQLPLLAGLPVCPECETFFKHRPFPLWVKAFLFGVIAAAVFVLVWNIRFVKAYVETKNSFRYFMGNDLEKAVEMMNSASNHVPESGELRGMASFYKGMLFLQRDNYTEALATLNSCRKLLPSKHWDKILDEYTTMAAIGAAFDNNDYDRFLALTSENYKKNPNDGFACAQVSSAYACKFAVTGDEQFKEKSLNMLDKARSLSKTDPTFQEYEQRILNRLYSREIITRSEFQKRFPNGWKEPKKE
ncbi:MAG: hypothetical protein ABSE89_08445 [Sedimentisphaerales bacterium]